MTRLVVHNSEPPAHSIDDGGRTLLPPAHEPVARGIADSLEGIGPAGFHIPFIPGAHLHLPPWHPSCHG